VSQEWSDVTAIVTSGKAGASRCVTRHVCEMESRSSAMRMRNAPVGECQVTFVCRLYIISPCLCPCFYSFRVVLLVSGSSWFSSYCDKVEDEMGVACGTHGGE